MARNAALVDRINSLHRMIVNMREVTTIVGLETQISLLEGEDEEVRAEWDALIQEIAQFSLHAPLPTDEVGFGLSQSPRRRSELATSH